MKYQKITEDYLESTSSLRENNNTSFKGQNRDCQLWQLIFKKKIRKDKYGNLRTPHSRGSTINVPFLFIAIWKSSTGDQINHCVEGQESVSRVKYSLSNHGHILAFSLEFNPKGFLKQYCQIWLFPSFIYFNFNWVSFRGVQLLHGENFWGGDLNSDCKVI